MKKRILLLVLLCLSLITIHLFAAGTEEAEDVQQEYGEEWSWEKASAPYRGTTVNVLLQTHAATDAMKPYIKEFEDMTGIKVQYEILQRRAMNTREEMELSARVGAYDITHIAPPKRARYVRADWVTPLDDFINNEELTSPEFDYNDFLEPFRKVMEWDGKIVGLPFDGECSMLYYRTDIFDEYGIEEPPKTIEELEEVASLIHTEDIPAFATRAVQGQGINVYTWVSFLKGYGGEFFNEDMEPVVNSKEAIMATEKYAELLNSYGPFGISQYTHYEVVTDFSQGKVAMMIDASTWGASTLNNPDESKVIDKWAITAVPAGPEKRAPDVYSHGMMIPKNSNNKEAAWLFMQWYTSYESQLKKAAKSDGSGSVTRESVFLDPEYQKWYNQGNWYEEFMDSLKLYAEEFRPNYLPEWLEVGDIVGGAVQSVIAGEAEASDALNQANKTIFKLMEESGYY